VRGEGRVLPLSPEALLLGVLLSEPLFSGGKKSGRGFLLQRPTVPF